MLHSVPFLENALDPASYEYSNEVKTKILFSPSHCLIVELLLLVKVCKPYFYQQVKYDLDLTWDEIGQTKDHDLDWSATNLQRTTTSESPFLLLPTIRTTTVESGHRKVTKDPLPPLRATQSGQVLSNSEEMQQHSTSMWSPEMTLPPETKGRANFNANALFNLTKTTKENSLYTTTAPLHRTIKIDGVHGGITLNGKGKIKGGISTTAPTVTTSKADYINRGLSQQDYSGKVTTTTPTITSAKTKEGNVSQSGNTATNVMSHISNVSSTTSSSTSFIQTKTDPRLAHPTNKDNTTDRSLSTKPRGIPEIQTESSTSKPSSSPTKTSVQLSRILVQTTKPLSNGESLFVFPSTSSSFTSSPLCDAVDSSCASSTCLHDPTSSWPVLSPLDSQLTATSLSPVKDPVSQASVFTLSASTLPYLPHPSHSLYGWATDPVFHGVGFDDTDSNDDVLSGSSSNPSVFSSTPPLQALLDPSAIVFTTKLSESSWDQSLSAASLSVIPTLEPSVHLSSNRFLFDPTLGLSSSFSSVFDNSRYATGKTIETFLKEGSGDRFPLVSDVHALCDCSLEPSASSPWLHLLNVELSSSAWDSISLELYSSLGFLSATHVDFDNFLHSLSVVGSDGLSLGQPLSSRSAILPSSSSSHSQVLQATQSDLPISVAATASAIMESWFSVSSVLTPSPTASPTTLASEGQVIDTSTSASGSGLFPDSQEGIDQEWDMVQTSTSGESMLPYSMNVISSASPSSSSEAGQNPDDLDEHSSAFYFESESSNALGFEVGDTTTEAVTSASHWSLGREEGSSSGQSESLYDNETSSDFSISEHTERELTEEEPVAGKTKQKKSCQCAGDKNFTAFAILPWKLGNTCFVRKNFEHPKD